MPDTSPQRNLIAILRGITPDEAVAVTQVLVEEGFALIEVPMNSPEPLESISRMAAAGFPGTVQIGGGTILTPAEVDALAATGGRFVVSPDCNPDVIQRTKEKGLDSWPGVFTATECFAALRNGADRLKLFPGAQLRPDGLKALRAVLPPSTPLYVVGGADAANFAEWLVAGATGFGIGSALYSSGASLEDIRQAARRLVTAFDKAHSQIEAAA
ncbi:MAG: 2-dehydro-3-deoxy-6-phosphogalactonate aldolase [Hyphomicrobiales bacterium]